MLPRDLINCKAIRLEAQAHRISSPQDLGIIRLKLSCWMGYYSGITWVAWRPKSPANRLFSKSLFGITRKKTTKLCITGALIVICGFPTQMASNAESVSMSWHYRGLMVRVWWRILPSGNKICHGHFPYVGFDPTSGAGVGGFWQTLVWFTRDMLQPTINIGMVYF